MMWVALAPLAANLADARARLSTQDVRELLAKEPSFFTAFSLVIAADQPDDVLYALSELCWSPAAAASSASATASLPLISLRTSGLVGEAAIQIKEAGSEWRATTSVWHRAQGS